MTVPTRKPAALLDAMRVPLDVTAPQERGLWKIVRTWFPPELDAERCRLDCPEATVSPYGWLTFLTRWTVATLNQPLGEVVMEDSPRELRRHLPVLLVASGRVLVSGLGLGCVLRGLLALPEVEHVDVVEIDRDVAAMVWPEFESERRCTLILGDTLKVRWPKQQRWDFAWHDVWCEPDAPDCLHLLHGRILTRYQGMVSRQGAWQFPRLVRERWPERLLGARAA